MSAFFEFVSNNAYWISVAFMPLTYGFVGWLTNGMALHMTFYPLKFWGIPPYIGWQGIVPRKASALALKSVNMLSERLVKMEDFFSRIKPQIIKEQFTPIIKESVPEISEHMIASLDGQLQLHFTQKDLQKMSKKATKESLKKLEQISKHLKDDVRKVFNFKALVLRSLTGDNVKLIVDIFKEVGSHEFRFILKSGWHFGASLGTIQIAIWYFLPLWYLLPVQGMIVGYVTNWLALVMIFRPLYEKKFMGIRYQGMFLKRQDEVSQKYAEIFSKHVLTGKNIMEEILYRRVSRLVVDIIEKDLIEILKAKNSEAIEIENIHHETEKFRKAAMQKMSQTFSQSSPSLEKIIERSMNVQKMIHERMRKLPPEEFEPILRSAFQEDEYILIVLGSLLGGFVGLLQGLYMLQF